VLADEAGGLLFVLAADLAAHHDGIGVVVGLERVEGVDEGGADDRVAADTDGGRLAEPALGEVVDDLVRQGTGAGDEPTFPSEKMLPGRMPSFASPG